MPSGADRRLFWSVTAVVIVADLVSKLVAEAALMRASSVSVIGDFFQLRLVYNPGAAFGLHLGEYSRWIFLTIALVAVVVLVRMSHQAEPGDRFRQLALGLICGGAFGNLIDRVRSPFGVVDFLDFGIGSLRWWTFNLADVAVSCGAAALAISLWREDARRAQAESASVG